MKLFDNTYKNSSWSRSEIFRTMSANADVDNFVSQYQLATDGGIATKNYNSFFNSIPKIRSKQHNFKIRQLLSGARNRGITTPQVTERQNLKQWEKSDIKGKQLLNAVREPFESTRIYASPLPWKTREKRRNGGTTMSIISNDAALQHTS